MSIFICKGEKNVRTNYMCSQSISTQEWCGIFKKIEQLDSGKCLSEFPHSVKKIISKELEKKNREWNESVIADMEKEK